MAIDIESLMIDALDGTISPADRVRLDAHLAQHPEQRAEFQRMQRLDAVLAVAPAVTAPPDFSERVMAATRHTHIMRPITRRHIAAFIATNSVLMVLAWLASGAALMTLIALVTQLPVVQPVLVFVRSVVVYMADLMGLFSTALRAVLHQPLFWVTMLALAALVAVWLSVLVKVLRPARA